MDWIQTLSKTIQFIEAHLTTNISVEKIAKQAFSSSSHFQLIFHVVMGITIGEYIRNRRLSLAAQDLLEPGAKIIDVAARYKYDTPESFSKAFTRFHGIAPSKAQRGNIKVFQPLTINISVQGGFDMSRKLIEDFLLLDISSIEERSAEAYKKLASWAGQARGRNPNVFDALTEWVLDDSKWTDDHMEENEWIFIHGFIGRFKEQNAKLRGLLTELEPLGVVNKAVFGALDRFDDELSGHPHDEHLRETVAKVFGNFKAMKDRSIREKIAGFTTGPHGTYTHGNMGYINYLKDCDASVQWTLFMPDMVKQQTKGFSIESFEYRKMPSLRFIGFETTDEYYDPNKRKEKMQIFDTMEEYKSDFDYDLLFMHHYGRGVDVEPWHGFWGRFMKADTPVPEGYLSFDLSSEKTGTPYLTFYSYFAFATFSGDIEAMHKREGFDSDAMYDVTRNIILGQGVTIPYPEMYWTAEVFLEGSDKPGTGYLFSAMD